MNSPADPVPESDSKRVLVGYGLLLLTMLIWGSFTLLSRWAASTHLSPWDVSALRFAVAAAVLVPIQFMRHEWQFLKDKRLIILGLTGGIGYATVAYFGFAYAPAAHGAIWLNGMLPLMTAIAAYFILSEPFSRDIKISLVIISLGLAAMVSIMAHQVGHVELGLGDVFFVLAAVLWGVYTALLKRWMLPPWHAMAGVALWSAVVYLPVYVLFLPKNLAEASTSALWTQALFQGIAVVIIAMLSFIGAVERLGAFRVGSILALAPLLAALAAVPILHEPLNIALGVGLIAISVAAIQPWRFLKNV